MRHRYSYLDPDLIRQLLAQMGLRRLFNHLLLQSGGDVEEAREKLPNNPTIAKWIEKVRKNQPKGVA